MQFPVSVLHAGSRVSCRIRVSAKTGEEADQPDNVDAIVTYLDKWQWDLTMYMIELQIIIRDPDSNFPFATGKSFHTSLTRLSPEKMVAEVLDNIYEKAQ